MTPNCDAAHTCAFTGHRPSRLPWRYNEQSPACADLKSRIYDTLVSLYNTGVRHFICGMAQGCDTYFAEAVLRLKDAFSDVTLEAAVPCENQDEKWPSASRARYRGIIEKCDRCTLISREYTADCMRRRNYYMVDSAEYLVCVYGGGSGGTLQTINYAKRRGRSITVLEPQAQH